MYAVLLLSRKRARCEKCPPNPCSIRVELSLWRNSHPVEWFYLSVEWFQYQGEISLKKEKVLAVEYHKLVEIEHGLKACFVMAKEAHPHVLKQTCSWMHSERPEFAQLMR